MADNDESISTLEMIDFGSLLGAPLTACVEAQAQAAAATTRYMQQVGFRMNNDSALEAKTMTFTYTIGYTVSTTTYAHADIDMTPMVLEKNKQYTIVFVIDGDNVESYVLREREAEQW